jgi:hypothetical protein
LLRKGWPRKFLQFDAIYSVLREVDNYKNLMISPKNLHVVEFSQKTLNKGELGEFYGTYA